MPEENKQKIKKYGKQHRKNMSAKVKQKKKECIKE